VQAALGATRIGHGIHIAADAALMRRARERGLHFEVCPSSNVHTGAAASLAAHPIRRMLAAGLSLSVSTDNRLMSGVSLSSELQAMHDVLGLELAQIRQMQREAARASFMPNADRAAALAAIGAR
jgi:adenosine deaminase